MPVDAEKMQTALVIDAVNTIESSHDHLACACASGGGRGDDRTERRALEELASVMALDLSLLRDLDLGLAPAHTCRSAGLSARR